MGTTDNRQRYYFIDNLRWVTVVLVLIYHVFYNFNAQGALVESVALPSISGRMLWGRYSIRGS